MKSDGGVITIEELDEALNAENKTDKDIRMVSRRIKGATAYLHGEAKDIKWRELSNHPVKISNNALYLGREPRLDSSREQKLS